MKEPTEPIRAEGKPPDGAAVDPATIDLTPSRNRSKGDRRVIPSVAIIEGSGARLSSETSALFQRRLRAATLFLIVTLSAFLVKRLLLGGDPLWPLQGAVITAMAAALVILSDPRPVPPRMLRVLEFAVFGVMAAYMATRQFHSMLTWGRRGDVASLLSTVKATIIGTMLLMFTYSMLIPNPWRRAARVIGLIAAVPIVTEMALYVTHPEVFRFARQVATVDRVSENLLIATVAAGLSVYGTHVINTLRKEVFEARQLNQYKLRERLGVGGMGEVYLAEHRLLRRACALKLIKSDNAADARSLARFEREVQAMARLSHPNTVDIYDYGHTDDGTFYYVMEYLPGLNLADLVDRYGPMPAGRVIYLLGQACDALAEAHSAGLIHRDLKPANIFASRRGGRYDVAKLLDFGLVKTTTEPDGVELSGEGTVHGTPLYMAPEQVTADRPLDHRCDLYAVGAVAYCLLTGHPPFEGENKVRVMLAHARDPVVPPSRLRPDLPDDLERVVLRCLAKDPDDRYPDAEDLRRALSTCGSAGTWGAQQAARWWHENEPDPKPSPAP
jgi:tRNA A-37 threonylcarbamoyl transferase component Bud32